VNAKVLEVRKVDEAHKMAGLELGPTTDTSSLERLSNEEKIDAMIEWFSQNF
jgi:hypothetical protein